MEALVAEELVKHVTLNSNRLRTCEDALLEIVTLVEAKFGLRIRDLKPSEAGIRGHCDPMDVDAINSLASGKGKGKVPSSPRDGCFQGRWKSFSERLQYSRHSTQRHRPERQTGQVMPKSAGKGKSKENKGEFQRKIQRFQEWQRFVQG